GLVIPAILAVAGALLLSSGCYERRSGNPVDGFHYSHSITVRADYSAVSIQTYINRTHLKVGYRREDLYDGNRDGELTTPGMDRVAITDYIDVEDPPDEAVRTKGDITDYDALFKKIIEAVKSGKKEYEIEDRPYVLRLFSENLAPLAMSSLG
ncbi:MAG: hypothetical protein KAY24_18850, partial [Candidatus Eisenbacteria sp.]|nr:hypothetical protein [Candidatus Eisenbacteria bacterium]